jgi:hypothetical protein
MQETLVRSAHGLNAGPTGLATKRPLMVVSGRSHASRIAALDAPVTSVSPGGVPDDRLRGHLTLADLSKIINTETEGLENFGEHHRLLIKENEETSQRYRSAYLYLLAACISVCPFALNLILIFAIVTCSCCLSITKC